MAPILPKSKNKNLWSGMSFNLTAFLKTFKIFKNVGTLLNSKLPMHFYLEKVSRRGGVTGDQIYTLLRSALLHVIGPMYFLSLILPVNWLHLLLISPTSHTVIKNYQKYKKVNTSTRSVLGLFESVCHHSFFWILLNKSNFSHFINHLLFAYAFAFSF